MRREGAMFNIIERTNDLLKATPSSYTEILYEFSAEYKIRKEGLPECEKLLAFTRDVPQEDDIRVIFSDGTTSVAIGAAAWIEMYENFTKGLYDTDEIIVTIKVQKKVHSGIINIYSLNAFSEFLNNRTFPQIFDNFVQLFELCGDCIIFHLLDTKGFLRTWNIAFSENEVEWKTNTPRNEQLKNCEDASVFLDRHKYPLLPQDFAVISPVEGSGFAQIQELFEKLRRIWSYVYLANSAYIASEKAILQFDPVGAAEEYDFTELIRNTLVPQIYDWIYKDDGCVDKASVSRKIVNVYCHDKQAILDMDDKVFNSIKSDYVIYQKNHADQYFDMKNKISECIVDCVRQMQELSHEVVEAFRNNFVAVIVFMMTVLLTDSVDFSQFLRKAVSPNVTAVCFIFTFGSALYLIVTIMMMDQKWKWIEQSFDDLKANYKDTLDDKDIDEAFNDDRPRKMAKDQYEKLRFQMIVLWTVMVIGLAVFSVVLYMNSNRTNMPETSVSSQESEINSDDNSEIMKSGQVENVNTEEGVDVTDPAENASTP